MCIDVQGLRTCEGFRWLSLDNTLDILCVAFKYATVPPPVAEAAGRRKRKKKNVTPAKKIPSNQIDWHSYEWKQASKLADVISRTGILVSAPRPFALRASRAH